MSYNMEDVKKRLDELNRKMLEGGELSEGEKREYEVLSNFNMDALVGRINDLYHKSQTEEGLTEGELREQAVLRNMYLESIRQSMKGQLDQIEFVDEDKE